MPIQFQPFVSLYSDPGIKEISTDLKTRYYENLKAKDSLSSALDQMVALSPDEETKNQLRSEADTTLEELAKDPALENQGMQIYNAVKGFERKYTQVKKQYDNAMSELQTLETKKDKGEVEPEYYDLVKANFFKDYKGIKFDEKGRVVQGSTFKAPTYYNSVDINEKLLKQLGILSPEETKTDVEDFRLSEDGTKYIYKKGASENSISLDRVRDAYNAILQTPDVDRYISDKIDKRYNLIEGVGSKINILNGYNNSIDMSNAEYQQQIEKNNSLLTATTSYADRTQLEANNKQLQELINSNNLKKKTNTGFMQELSQGKEDGAETQIKSLLKEQELSPYKQYGDAKAFRSYSTSEGIDQVYKNMFAQQQADAQKWLLENPEIKATGNVTAAHWGGINTKAKKENIATYRQSAKELQVELDKGIEDKSFSPELIKKYESQIQSAKNAADDIQNQVESALEKTVTAKDIESIITDPGALEILKNLYPSSASSNSKLLSKIIDTFDNEGDQDFIDFKTKYIEAGGEWVTGTDAPERSKAFQEMTGEQQEAMKKKMERNVASKIIQNLDQFVSNRLDPAYLEIKQSPMFDYGAQTSISEDPMEVRRLTTAINKYFTDKPIGENLKVTIQGSPGDNIGNTEFNNDGIAELTGKDLANYTVKKIGYATYVGGKGMFQVELSKSGETGSNIVGLIDGQQLSGTEIDKAVNRPEASIARAINKLNPRDIDASPRVRTLRMYDADGNIIKGNVAEMHVRTGESGDPEVALGYNTNGKLELTSWMPSNSETIKQVFTQKHSNGSPVFELLD